LSVLKRSLWINLGRECICTGQSGWWSRRMIGGIGFWTFLNVEPPASALDTSLLSFCQASPASPLHGPKGQCKTLRVLSRDASICLVGECLDLGQENALGTRGSALVFNYTNLNMTWGISTWCLNIECCISLQLPVYNLDRCFSFWWLWHVTKQPVKLDFLFRARVPGLFGPVSGFLWYSWGGEEFRTPRDRETWAISNGSHFGVLQNDG